nr:MAG TPA: hypothetical protein [Caudoviricetes sp.]
MDRLFLCPFLPHPRALPLRQTKSNDNDQPRE